MAVADIQSLVWWGTRPTPILIWLAMLWVENGYMHVNEAPGLGVDVDEKEAAKYPLPEKQLNIWMRTRAIDGTPIRP